MTKLTVGPAVPQVREGRRLCCPPREGPEPGLRTHHESVVRKLVPALDVLHEVGAAVVGVSPRHRGTYGTNLSTEKHSLRRLESEVASALCPVSGLLSSKTALLTRQSRAWPLLRVHIRISYSSQMTHGGRQRLRPRHRPFIILYCGQNHVQAQWGSRLRLSNPVKKQNKTKKTRK